MLGILKKLPCWKRLFFSENFPIGKIISLCVGPVLWCVGTLSFFQGSSVCGLCVVVCGDFEFFKVPLCVKLCPCTGEIEFSQKIPVLGIFPRWWSRKAVKKNVVYADLGL